MASSIFKIGVTSRRAVWWVRFPHALAILLVATSAAGAQRAGAPALPPLPRQPLDTLPDSLRRPPIAPRRAMLLSLAIPGYAQSRLNRPTAAVLFATTEILALGMARKAGQDLREAKAARKDSVPTGFSADPATGALVPTGFTQNRLVPRIGARKTHYEDWIATIIFNHIIAGADAYVAANLWDFRANVAIAPGGRAATLGASRSF